MLGEYGNAPAYLQAIRQMVHLRGGLRTNTAWERFVGINVTA
jgi:hypothetical protein